MTPTKLTQTRFGGSDTTPDEQGDCWATAVCSLYGQTVRARDDLHKMITKGRWEANGDPSEWWEKTLWWLKDRGLPELIFEPNRAAVPEGLVIESGASPRVKGGHVVLVEWPSGVLWHDPHPDGGGVVDPDEWFYARANA